MKTCKNCGNDLRTKHQKKFCSRSCAATFNNKRRVRTEESKNKTSNILKTLYKEGKILPPLQWTKEENSNYSTHRFVKRFQICVQCKELFVVDRPDRKYCSRTCKYIAMSETMKSYHEENRKMTQPDDFDVYDYLPSDTEPSDDFINQPKEDRIDMLLSIIKAVAPLSEIKKNGPYTPMPEGNNDGVVRDRYNNIVADMQGHEANAALIALFLNLVYETQQDQ